MFVRLAEADLEKRRISLHALTQTVMEEKGTYQPQTTGRKALRRNLAAYANSVSKYLYAQGVAELARKKAQEAREDEEVRRRAEPRYAAGRSERLVEGMKGKTYKLIFEALFPEGGREGGREGGKEVLVLEEATLERIKQSNLAQALSLVLSHASSSSSLPPSSSSPSTATLDFPTFSLLLDKHLHPSLPLLGDLITHACRPGEGVNEELTFHPSINKESERLAEGRWSTRTREEVYQLLHGEAALREERREEAREEKASHLLDDHTFHPIIMTFCPAGGREGGREGKYRYPAEIHQMQEPKEGRERVKPDARAKSVQAVRAHGRMGGREGGRARSIPPQRKRGVYNQTLTKVDDSGALAPGENLREYLEKEGGREGGREGGGEVYVDRYRPVTPSNPKSHHSFPMLQHQPLAPDHITLRPRKEAWHAAMQQQQARQRQAAAAAAVGGGSSLPSSSSSWTNGTPPRKTTRVARGRVLPQP